ncbi:centrosomal protein of 70 kDa isoform X2 [Callorhinchus milii]|uniref:centrosomal protein of 70 kDa isoform X2 n=1 Tax=Callorhinchus milii TaxID=7868 RepID=UPI0004574EAF|nr:centrosomal protein of 70 kDa isoform X2 [Callorhinchus milii]|eukprot:gi/632969741/ref/XP_007901248.1/ PREDICTED: centrosomal protein of 70 kDa isoform X2 [Callorhinchus milii]
MTSICHLLSGEDEDYFVQHEQVEWEILNKLLQHHGFNPIHLADPQTKDLTAVVLLGKQSGIEIRHVVATLIKDTERRQALIRDLIQSNNELKNDLRQQQSKASRYEQRASDLEHIVEDVKGKIQDLESDFLAKDSQQKNLIEQLEREKQDSQVHHQQLKQKLHEQEETILRLQKKLYMVVTEEEQRIERRNKIFHKFHKRVPKTHSAFDQQLLDETQNHRTQQDWRKDEVDETVRKRREHSRNKGKNKYSVPDTISNRKTLVKVYEDYLQESRAKNEKIFQKQWNYKFLGNGDGKDEKEGKWDSMKIEDIDYMQGSDCKRFLKNLCKEIQIQDVNNLIPAVRERSKLAAACPKLQKILNDINSVVSNGTKSQKLFLQSHAELGVGNILMYENLVSTVEKWAEQLMALKDLHRSLKKLSKLGPWKLVDLSDPSHEICVQDLQLIVDEILNNLMNKKNMTGLQESKQPLEAIVSHFQKLFDVTSLSGVYPRMNEVYSKLGEISNVMRSLKQLLGLA